MQFCREHRPEKMSPATAFRCLVTHFLRLCQPRTGCLRRAGNDANSVAFSLLDHGHTAVDVDRLAGDVGGLVGGEIDHRAGHFVGRA